MVSTNLYLLHFLLLVVRIFLRRQRWKGREEYAIKLKMVSKWVSGLKCYWKKLDSPILWACSAGGTCVPPVLPALWQSQQRFSVQRGTMCRALAVSHMHQSDRGKAVGKARWVGGIRIRAEWGRAEEGKIRSGKGIGSRCQILTPFPD